VIGEGAVMETDLAQRESNGIAVTLLWHSGTQRLTVTVRDLRTGDAFDVAADARNAMDVFHHPYAYAAAA
jgi:phage FluMu protein gp41